MSVEDKIIEIDTILTEIGNLLSSTGGLKEQDNERLWKKLILEWNYNSNHIEGNTLTYKETELLLIFNNTTGDHKLREIEEMKAHNAALQVIREWAQEKDRKITEADIRALNKIILVEPFWKEAITSQGLQSRIEVIPGKYKDQPNHVLLQSGEIFKYAEPEEVGPKMQILLSWYNAADDIHPIIKAALLHYRFILIHPFGDGNGRIARLLMNYHLMKNDYLPVIIKSADKQRYLFALNKADVGDIDAFVEYITEQCIWSLDLFRKAVKGESLEEPEDWKKELKQISNTADGEPVRRTTEILLQVFNKSIAPGIMRIIDELESEFNPLFQSNRIVISLGNNSILPILKTGNKDLFHLLDPINHKDREIIKCDFKWNDYKKNGLKTFDVEIEFNFLIDKYSYEFKIINDIDFRLTKGYDQYLTDEEIRQMISMLGKSLVAQIQRKK